jgi:hypothetical protein
VNAIERRKFIKRGTDHYGAYNFDPLLNCVPNLDSSFADLLVNRYGRWGSQWFLVEVATQRFREAVRRRLDIAP